MVYQAVTFDNDKRTIYLKMANPNPAEAEVKVNWTNVSPSNGYAIQLIGKTGEDTNSMEEPDNIIPQQTEITETDRFIVPPFSVNFYILKY